MTLQDFLNTLPGSPWFQVPMDFRSQQGQICVSKKERRSLMKDLRDAIENGSAGDAANLLYAGLMLDEAPFLYEIQKNGVLRLSRYSYSNGTLVSVVDSLLKHDIGLSAHVLTYLGSVSNLHVIAGEIRNEYELLREWLSEEREVGIKSALACLDFLFLKHAVGIHETNKCDLSSRDEYFFTVEELAEGMSSLLALYGNEFGVLETNPAINQEAVLRGDYFGAMNSAAHISEFREWEFKVDRQGYAMTQDAEGKTYTLRPPSYEFGRAVELGFIQVRLQGMLKTFDALRTGGVTFREVAKQLTRVLDELGLITMEGDPPRYRIGLPVEILAAASSCSETLLEERAALLQACRDLLTPPQELLSFKLTDEATFQDLMIVSRVIQLIRGVAAEKLIPELDTRPELVFQSIIPTFERDQLLGLVASCVGEEAAKEAISFWTTDIQGHVDLQYRPLIPVGDKLWLPANVFGNSNVLRNPLVILERRLYEDGTVDPLSELVADQLRKRGFQVRTRLEYDTGEVDVLASLGDLLFAFECKNSLVPTGAHELMTSLDYVHEAARQLDRFASEFQSESFRARLCRETGFPIGNATKLCTGIVLSNRMFMGFRASGHPVRGAYEIEQFLDEGTVSMGEHVHRHWREEAFSPEDLRRFLDEDITYHPMWESMEPYSETYEFGETKVLVERLRLNSVTLALNYGFDDLPDTLQEQQDAFEKMVTEFSLIEHFAKNDVQGDEV